MKENTNKIEINHLIAICNIIDNYDTFNKNLIEFLKSSKYQIESICKLGKISNSEFSLPYPKILNFYKKNKEIIDIINKYSHIHTFICQNYQFDKENISFKNQQIYDYILANKEKLNDILNILIKLKNLGFTTIDFNENIDFRNEKYHFYTTITGNYEIIYLDNLEAIPSYSYGQIEYRTKDSNYKMVLGLLGTGRDFCKYGLKIFLNSLTFDPNKLPNEISHKEITNKILVLPDDKQEEYSIIRTSVDLSTCIDDLYITYLKVSKSLEYLSNFNKKEELLAILSTIKNEIIKLKELSTKYDEEQIINNQEITKSILSEEKESYQRRREFSRLHID